MDTVPSTIGRGSGEGGNVKGGTGDGSGVAGTGAVVGKDPISAQPLLVVRRCISRKGASNEKMGESSLFVRRDPYQKRSS